MFGPGLMYINYVDSTFNLLRCLKWSLLLYVINKLLFLFLIASCFLNVFTDEANTIYLKCSITPFSDPCSVLDHQVPVFICEKDALASSEWDITTQQVSWGRGGGQGSENSGK